MNRDGDIDRGPSSAPRPDKRHFNPQVRDKPMIALLIVLGATFVMQVPLFYVSKGFSLVFIGLSQLVYMVPLAVEAHTRGRRREAMIYLILMGLVFLVNAGCFAYVMTLEF